ncbi:4Fe-4S binding protein [Dyadobacter luticola]|uniref:4Fe-4S dicluster domain-containing protein n=1 Tax=Dyadobacter luticola TaxID=1979387 RepID=A0A5R9KVP5_9BACT|nr:4Fe-4S binding protein [Dyadobacter luticola]TLV00159.1 4Fe-4S dicluster domain-containing protein [Dyadobacter luticola]
MSTYFKNISEGINTTVTGLKLTLRHLWSARNRRKPGDIRSGNFYDQQDGMVTIQYPLETIPIPDNGRYRLHNEMDDCIVCDKCVKVCPVDCIEIEPIRAIEEVGRASDGSPIRLYAAKFDIDMAKCCYCGLCTTVCPTECLTMTKTFDYSELDVRDMVYNYANLTPDEADEKRRLLDQFQKEKEALKAAAKPAVPQTEAPAAPAAKPVFKPTIKPKAPVAEAKEENVVESKAKTEKPAPKAPFRPVMKPKPVAEENIEKPISENPAEPVEVKPAAAKPPFRPSMKPKVVSEEPVEKPVEDAAPEITAAPIAPKPAFRPTMKPKVVSEEGIEKPIESPSPEPTQEIKEESPAPKPKPAFRPSMKPKPKE